MVTEEDIKKLLRRYERLMREHLTTYQRLKEATPGTNTYDALQAEMDAGKKLFAFIGHLMDALPADERIIIEGLYIHGIKTDDAEEAFDYSRSATFRKARKGLQRMTALANNNTMQSILEMLTC